MCTNGKCGASYTCANMLVCGVGCNFKPECILGCYGQGDEQSKALFAALAICVGAKCGLSPAPACVIQATTQGGPCDGTLKACLADN